MNKNSIAKTLITGTVSIAFAAILFAASSVSAESLCNTVADWTRFGGYSLSQCHNGLGFPAINAFNDKTVLQEASHEWEFAYIRLKDRSSNSAPRYGFSNNVTLSTSQLAQSYIYIHNSGNPNCNTEDTRELSRRGCPRSTIAKNVKLKIVSGLSREANGDYVSGAGTTHTITYEISSSNTTPLTLRDSFTITTQAGKRVKLKMDAAEENVAEICTEHGPVEPAGDRDCLSRAQQAFDPTLLFSTGMPIRASYAGSGNTTDFFASEGYRIYVYNTFVVEDAPTESRCESLTLIRDSVDADRHTAVFRVDLNPDNAALRGNLNAIVRGGGTASVDLGRNRSESDVRINVFGWTADSVLTVSVDGETDPDCTKTYSFKGDSGGETCTTLNYEVRSDDPVNRVRTIRFTTIPENEDFHGSNMNVTRTAGVGTADAPSINRGFLGLGTLSTDITFRGWNESTRFTVAVNGQPNCSRPIRFELPQNVCTDLTATANKDGDNVRVDFTVYPGNFDLTRNPITYLEVGGPTRGLTVTPQTSTRYLVSSFNGDTVLDFYVRGFGTDCAVKVSFKDFADQLCRSLNMSPDSYSYDRNPRPTFTINPTPTRFNGPFIYSVKDEDGTTIETLTTNSKTFTPTRQLDGTQTVHVDVDSRYVQSGYTCRDQADSDAPPIGERCENIDIVRSVNGRSGFIPQPGESIKLRLEADGYEGNVIWRSNNPGVTFVTRDGGDATGLKTDVENEVIVRVSPTARPDRGTRITVEADEAGRYRDCTDFITATGEHGDKPTKLTKIITGPLGNPKRAIVNNGQEVTYKVTVDVNDTRYFDGVPKSVKIYDDALLIRGISELPTKGQLRLVPGSMRVTANNRVEPEPDPITMFGPEGLIINNFGVRNNDQVVVTYRVKVDSKITPESCNTLKENCGETFINTARDSFGSMEQATVLTLCPFMLSRGFGDVYLEETFNAGVDIAQCFRKKSSEGAVFKPVEKDNSIASSGAGDIVKPSHRVCENSGKKGAGNLEGYNGDIEGFSSSVCEVAMENSEKWQKENIVNNIKANVERIAKGNTTLSNVTSPLTALTDDILSVYDSRNPNPKTKVYKKSGDLTIGSGETVYVSGKTKTVIVENGDLIINSNIEYDPTDKTSVIAFLVINGDIKIAPSVTKISGIFAAVNVDGEGGKITRTSDSDKTIEIYGSVFGNIQPLFTMTSATGSVLTDRGAVTVIYDGRIVGNTPPGLNDIVKFNQFQSSTGYSIYSGE